MKEEPLRDRALLSTKLKMPAPRKNYIIRRRLFKQLSRCNERKVVYVSGAAGTGKTTLLSSFIRETGLAHTAWLSLDEANDNVFSFWHYFAAAAGEFLGEDREEILEILRSGFDPSQMEGMLTVLINRLCGGEDRYIVLDDVHVLKDPALLRTLQFFLGAMPEQLHLFMLSREDPALYLGELAVGGQLLFIDGDSLRFTHEEGVQFLRKTLGLEANEDEIARINALAEGWVGGLQLAAAAGGRGRNALFSAGGGIAADYLTREVLEGLCDEERRFLSVTGILPYFDAPLCAELLEDVDFEGMVGGLFSKNLFLICIDEENGIYRYHNILGRYLERQFEALPKPDQLRLRQKAAQALLDHGDKEEALRQLFAAEDYEGAARVLKTMEETVETWIYIDRLPISALMGDLSLAVQDLIYNVVTMNFDRGRAVCQALEKHFGDTDAVQAAVQFVYPYLSNRFEMRFTYSEQTLEQIEGLAISPVARQMLLIENAVALSDAKDYETAAQFARRAHEIGGVNLCADFYVLGTMAQLAEETGRLNESLRIYERMGGLFKSAAAVEVIGINLYVGVVGVYLKRMEAQKAGQALANTRRLLDKAPVPQIIVEFGYQYNLAEYELMCGEPARGAEIVKALAGSSHASGLLKLDRLLTACLTRGVLEPSLAERFLAEYEQPGCGERSFAAQMLYARLLLRRGEADAALAVVDGILSFSRENQNRLRLVEAGLLKLRVMGAVGAAPGRTVYNLLREAISYAWENRILQPFYIERDVAAPLLADCLKRDAGGFSEGERLFVRDALAVCGGGQSAGELLSAREAEVLRELANGYTNPEIASRLCISLSTVKTHIVNIYGKLGVSSRLSAAEEAKRLGLIG